MEMQHLGSPRAVSPSAPPKPGPPGEVEHVERKLKPEPAPLTTRLAAGAAALADGTFRVGPKHTWHAIKKRPLQYAALLGGIGAAGAGLMATGIVPEPYMVGLSVVVCGWSAYKGGPEMRACEGPDRMRSIGSNVLWPAVLCVGTVAAGHPFGFDSPIPNPGPAEVATAGAQSAFIGADIPTIAQTVLDVPKGPREKRRFRRWLFGHGPAKAPDA